jgi:hypothetical protein
VNALAKLLYFVGVAGCAFCRRQFRRRGDDMRFPVAGDTRTFSQGAVNASRNVRRLVGVGSMEILFPLGDVIPACP